MLSSINGIYYFRVAIPLDIRKVFGQSEIKKSLKTRNRKEAKVSASLYRSTVESLFFGIRCGMISEDQAKKIRSKIIAECIEGLHNGKNIAPTGLSFNDMSNHINNHIYTKDQILDTLANKKVPDTTDIVEEWESSCIRDDSIGNKHIPSYLLQRVIHFIIDLGIDVLYPNIDTDTIGSVAHNDIRLNKDFIDLCIIVENTLGKVCNNQLVRRKYDIGSYDQNNDIIKMYKDGLPDPKISELWDAYYKDKTVRNSWNTRSAERYFSSYNRVLDILGDLELVMIGSQTVTSLTAKLKLYPKNKNKIMQFKDKPFSKTMAKMPGFMPLSVKSINFDIELMSALFHFALLDRRRWRVDQNPFLKKQIVDVKQKEQDEIRRVFTTKEIEGIMDQLSKVRRLVEPEKFWVPLICLYSGMRINEACQLRLKDIEEVDGISVFQLHHLPKFDLTTKNKKDRTVPIHKTLQSLGFLDYVLKQRSEKEERLFPNLKPYKGKWYKKVDAWFNRTVLRSHLKLDKEVSFHSTKHSFVNWFKQNVNMNFTELAMLKTIAAHFDDKGLSNKFDDGGITTNLYGKSYNIKALYDFINMLDYKIDLSVLEQKTL